MLCELAYIQIGKRLFKICEDLIVGLSAPGKFVQHLRVNGTEEVEVHLSMLYCFENPEVLNPAVVAKAITISGEHRLSSQKPFSANSLVVHPDGRPRLSCRSESSNK